MNLNGSQRKVYLLALAVLAAAIVLAVVWMTGRSGGNDPVFEGVRSVVPEAAAPSAEPAATLQPEATEEAAAKETVSSVAYYQDNYGYLVPVMCKLPMEAGIARATLSVMVSNAENDMQAARMGLRTVLPEDISIDLDISEGVARIDLGREALEMADAAAETNMVNAVVQTLTEFPTVEKVEFLIDGKKIDKLTHGTPVEGQFARGVINLESVSVASTMRNAKMVTLYFPGDSQTVVVPVTRVVYQEPDLDTAVLELTKGPSGDSALEETVPSGCGLIGVEVVNGVAKLNFTEDFLNILNNTDGGRLALKALLMTCTQFDGVDSVEILIEGEPLDLGEDAMAVPTYANIADSIVYDSIQTQSALIFDFE